MQRQELITRLLETTDRKIHRSLLQKNPDSADIKLASALKEVCYETWTSEPTKAQNAAFALKSLVKLNPNNEILALSFWVSGIAEITKGKLESAIINLNKSAEYFLKINKEHEAAQTQVSKLYALALLGKYDEAIESGENALKIFEKYDDELAAGKIKHNIGNLFYRREIYQKAKKYFYLAHECFSKLKDTNQLAMIENNLAAVYVGENNFHDAETFYESALIRVREIKTLVTEAEIEAHLGNLAMFRGRFDQALKFLELSRRKFEFLEMPHQMATAELEIADIYLELNLADEAFSIYETIVTKLQKLKMQGEEARARANFGRVATVLKKTKLARLELKKAARLYLAEKNKVGAAVVKLTQANLELISQKYKNALKLIKEAENLLENSGNIRHKLTAKLLEGETLRNLGEYETAERLLEETFAEASKQEQRNIAQVSLNSLGKIALQTGDTRKAEKNFKKAVELIETLRAPLPAEEFRMAFLADKLAPFENLARIYLAENNFKQAFLYVEKARARSLTDNLDDVHEAAELSKGLQEKLQNSREELNWFYSRLNRAEEAEIETLQREAKLREKQIADIMRQIDSTKTGNANLSIERTKVSERNADAELKQLQKLLGNQKVLIEFVNFDGNLSAFVVTDKKIHFIADLAKEDDIISLLESLQFQFGALRYGAKVLDKFLSELKRRTDFYLQKLYEKLLRPLESFIGERDLVIVPVGAAYYVPFHALSDGKSYVIETREVVYTPGATVWQKLSARPARKPENALLIGFADERIPLVNQEIETLEKIFKKSKSFTNEKATFSAFIENASKFDVLHLACHGQFRPENPLFSSLHLADGFVTVRDICSTKLKAKIVTLSACETGLNKIFAGDEILGLARGFLSAGATSLILSLWTVNDAATSELMKIFYTEVQRGETAAAALRKAQGNFIRQGFHPYFWSPFVLVGK